MNTERAVLVTGSTGGLGAEVVRKLASEGYLVVAAGRKLNSKLEEIIAMNPPGRVRFMAFDFSNPAGIRDFVKCVVSETKGLYGLVNNAAVGEDGILATMHDSQIEKVLRINVLAPILLTKYACRAMLAKQDGRIVNITSIIAHTGFSGLSVYAASKAALAGFTRSLARELGKANITVNAIAPGYMRSGMTASLSGEKLKTIERRSPLGRLTEAAEVAEAVSFLMGEAGRAITGTTIVVDAGSTA